MIIKIDKTELNLPEIENDIFIKYEKEIKEILSNYLFKFNTENTRMRLLNDILNIPKLQKEIRKGIRKEKLEKLCQKYSS